MQTDTVTNEATTETPRDRPFNPFRAPRTERARKVVAEVLNQVANYEKLKVHRVRKRRAVDQAILEQAVAALVCDLLHRHLLFPGKWVAQSLSNRYMRKSRYRSSILGNRFSPLLEVMASRELAFIEFRKGQIAYFQPWNPATTLRAGKRLITRAKEHELTSEDFSIDESEETIVLKHPKSGTPKYGDDRQEYTDTEATRRYRSEMARINQWLGRAEIHLFGVDDREVNVHDRRLRRVFNGSFEQGGRLFGGFWMNMKKRFREDLSIDECEIAIPDYSQMMPTALYAKAGHPFPEQDAYAIPGYERHRKGMKKLFNAMVHSKAELNRFPEDLPESLTKGRKFADVSGAIRAAHAPIEYYFYRGAGLEFMFHESNVLVEVLLRLIDEGITALPIHDAVMVPKVHLKTTMDTMRESFKDYFGIYPKVTVEG